MSGQRATVSNMWIHTIRNLEVAVSNLELFEGESTLVDDSLLIFNKLLTLGQTLEEVSTYKTEGRNLRKYVTTPATPAIIKHVHDQDKAVSPQIYDTAPMPDAELISIIRARPSSDLIPQTQKRLSENMFDSDNADNPHAAKYENYIKNWEQELRHNIYWDVPNGVADKPFEQEDDKSLDIPKGIITNIAHTMNQTQDPYFYTKNDNGYSYYVNEEQKTYLGHDNATVMKVKTSPSIQSIVEPQQIACFAEGEYWKTEQQQEIIDDNVNDDNSNWLGNTKIPDTMEIPLENMPILSYVGGPRLMNPNDDQISSHDGSQSNEESDIERDFNKSRAKRIEAFPSFVESIAIYTNDGPSELLLLKLDRPKHLDMVELPPFGTDYTVAICYHVRVLYKKPVLKGLQLYISTGEAYIVQVESACPSDTVRKTFKDTMIGRLLTDNSINRVCWSPEYIQNECLKKLGCSIGKCMDLSKITLDCGVPGPRFTDAVEYFLNDWGVNEQFEEARDLYEQKMSIQSKASKLNGFGWDVHMLPEYILQFSALHGLITYQVYAEALKKTKLFQNLTVAADD